MSSVFEGILLGIAGNLATTMLVASNARLDQLVRGSAEWRALEGAYTAAFAATLQYLQRSDPAGSDRHGHHIALLEELANDKEAGKLLLQMGLNGDAEVIPRLRARAKALGLDPTTWPGDFDITFTYFAATLFEVVTDRAGAPRSALYNCLSLTFLREQNVLLRSHGTTLDSLARAVERLGRDLETRRPVIEQMMEFDVPPTSPAVSVFLACSEVDNADVHALRGRLITDGFKTWFAEDDLLGGQDRRVVVRRVLRQVDVVAPCFSTRSVRRAGPLHADITFALEHAAQLPELEIYIVPLRLDACDVPERLRAYLPIDLFDQRGYPHLIRTLQVKAAAKAVVEEQFG